MHKFTKLIELTTDATEALASQDRQFSRVAADLLLRNVTVAVDRIGPDGCRQLTPESIDIVLDAASAAATVTPLVPVRTRRPDESAAAYAYRTTVTAPLDRLRRQVGRGNYDECDDQLIHGVKDAVLLGGKAFGAILAEESQHRRITPSIGYFWRNSTSAAAELEYLEP